MQSGEFDNEEVDELSGDEITPEIIPDDEPQKCVFVSDGVYKYIKDTHAAE